MRSNPLRGDMHVHTTWSDGGDSLETMVRSAAAFGYEWVAITDHSPRLRIANGLTAERLAAQAREIDEVQSRVGIRIFKGIEVDILADGSLDQSDETLAALDVVVASIHSNLRDDRETMTRRMVAAIANPHTRVLGHCTGRLVGGERGTRPASAFDPEVVFAACAMFGVAVEVNCKAERRDPPDDLLVLAAEAGCEFAINSDAHAADQLARNSTGWRRVVRLGIDSARVLNTRSADEVRAGRA